MTEEFNFDSLKIKLQKRSSNSHKGDFGRVMVVGGSEGMGGAAILSSEASLFCGSGLVHLNTHPKNVEASLIRNPEIMAQGVDNLFSIQSNISVLLCGPGLKEDNWSQSVFNTVLKDNKKNILLYDAGALRLLSRINEIDSCKETILTPHPGEAAELLNISVDEVQKNRVNAAELISEKYKSTVVLKGKHTIVCSMKNKSVFICSDGGPELSTGGTGDVLAGVISSLVAQNLDIVDACLLSVAAHAKAGELFANDVGEIGLNASSLIPIIRDLINK